MKKNFIITESQYIKFILENVNLEDYDADDFAEVFYLFFRPWVKKTHGEEVGKLPISYLAKKYVKEFSKDLGIDVNERYGGYSISSVVNLGKQIVKKGIHQLPTMRETKKFTEKYKKHIETIISELNTPEFMKIILIEQNPYDVKFKLQIDYVQLMNSDYKRIYPRYVYSDFKKYIEDYMGIEIGRVTHGQLSLDDEKPEILNFDVWQKNEFNKIKTKIKNIPEAKGNLHSVRMKMEPSDLLTQINLIYRDVANYQARGEIRKKAREIIDSCGQNKNYIKLES